MNRRKSLGWALAAALALPGVAAAVRIDEVMAGAYGRPEIQFVELEISCLFGPWAGDARLSFLDAADLRVGEFVFPADPLADASCAGERSVLIATPAFAALPGAPQPDFLMPPLLVPGSGKVCFEVSWSSPLCLSYGGFTGDSLQESPENAPPLPAEGVCSLRRVIFSADGGGNRNADFDLLAPAPRNGAGVTGVVTVPPRFADVPAGSPFRPFVEALFNAGVTGGCGGSSFCPQSLVTRDQMAVLLLRSREGTSFQPPACTVPVFADVPCSSPFAPWINELAARGITGGCGGGNYCPGAPVTRAAMAVFLLLAREGSSFQPPACTAPVFADVPCSDPFAPWINELAARGITAGCGGPGGSGMGSFCPDGAVTREQMAVFLSTAFGLPVPTSGCLDPMFADDHGDLPAAATAVIPGPAAPGTLVPGRLERPRDVDVFSFPAQAGQVFVLVADSGDPGDVPFVDPGFAMRLRVLDAAGQVLAESPVPSPYQHQPTVARLVFTAPAAGPFFAEVRDAGGFQTGGYQLSLRGPVADDHGGTPAEATPVEVDGAAVAGEIALPGDEDTFSFAATAGVIYEIEAIAGVPGMTFLFSFRDAGDQPVNGGISDGYDTAYFFAPATGTFFVTVGLDGFSRPVDTGPYTLRIRAIADDHGNTPATATALQSGVEATGWIHALDADVFHFTGEAGELVRVTVRLLDYSHGVQAELFRLEGGSEEILGELDLFSLSGGVLVATLPESGSYFLRLRADFFFEQPVKSYSISLEAPAVEDDHGDDPATATPVLVDGPGVAGQIEYPGEDLDVFAFAAAAGEPLEVRLDRDFFGLRILRADGTVAAGDGFDERLIFTADAGGTYYAEVRARYSGWGSYHLTVRGLDDDHGDEAATATPLVPGAPPTAGEIDIPEDVDFFSFPAVAGQWLVIKLAPSDPILQFTDLRIFDTDGTTRLFYFPRFTFPNLVFAFQAPVTGTYFLQVFDDVGAYEVSVGPPIADDHGPTAATATLTAVDAPPVSGTIEVWADSDSFAFDAVAGQILALETSGLTGGLDTLVGVYLPDGTFLERDDDGGGGLASRLVFTAPETGRYTAYVAPVGFSTGSYLFSVTSSP